MATRKDYNRAIKSKEFKNFTTKDLIFLILDIEAELRELGTGGHGKLPDKCTPPPIPSMIDPFRLN